MTSIYLAAPWVNREAMRVVRDDLVAMGHVVTSRWLDIEDLGQSPVPDDFEVCREAAINDFDDIIYADMFLVLTDERPVGAGHHVELGYALALGKHVVVVGPIKSIFHHLADHHYATWEEAKARMTNA